MTIEIDYRIGYRIDYRIDHRIDYRIDYRVDYRHPFNIWNSIKGGRNDFASHEIFYQSKIDLNLIR